MKVLVTGHKGYIGSILTPMLAEQGFTVSGLDNDLYRNSLFGPLPEPVTTTTKDIRDIELEDLTGHDAVIHLAGLSNDPLGDLNPSLTLEINYQATVRLAELAKKAGVRRFLFASSCSIYGASDDRMLDEEAPTNPVTPYARSKILAEEDVSALADIHFSPTFFRCATAHGYSPCIRFDLVVNNLVAWACTTGKVLIKSDGTPWRPFVHVGDICRAFIAVLNTPVETVRNLVLNVGDTTENYQIREVAEYVRQAVQDCQVEYAPDGEPDKRCYRVSCDRISKLVPQFKPIWKVQDSILDLHQKYSTIGLEQGEFEGPRYNRIAHLKSLLHSGKLDNSLRWNK